MKLKLFTIGLLATIAMTSTTIEAAQRQRAQVQAAQEVPVLKHVIASHEELTKALMDPATTIANGTPLDLALRAASADVASAANGVIGAMPGGTAAEKIDAIQRIEGAGAADNPHKIAIRQALGLKSDPGSLIGGSRETAGIRRFHQIAYIELVEHPAVAAALVGLGGGATPQLKLNEILRRLNTATRSAIRANPFGGGGAAGNIDAALTRAGL